MNCDFDSAELLQRLKKKFEDEDLTLSREQVSFLFDYIEALELALHYASCEEDTRGEHFSLEAAYVKEALMPLPELDDNGIYHNPT